jgi:hypothetical protein
MLMLPDCGYQQINTNAHTKLESCTIPRAFKDYSLFQYQLKSTQLTNMVRSSELEASHCSEQLLPAAMDDMMIRPRVLLRVVRFELDETNTDTETRTRTHVERKTASPLFSTLTTATCAQLWYHTAEISTFKRQVGTILLSSGNKNQEDLCGLERHSIERDRAKKAAIKLVILAQSMQSGDSDDFLKLGVRKMLGTSSGDGLLARLPGSLPSILRIAGKHR